MTQNNSKYILSNIDNVLNQVLKSSTYLCLHITTSYEKILWSGFNITNVNCV